MRSCFLLEHETAAASLYFLRILRVRGAAEAGFSPKAKSDFGRRVSVDDTIRRPKFDLAQREGAELF